MTLPALGQGSWSCQLCTFRNEDMTRWNCETCGHLRGQQSHDVADNDTPPPGSAPRAHHQPAQPAPAQCAQDRRQQPQPQQQPPHVQQQQYSAPVAAKSNNSQQLSQQQHNSGSGASYGQLRTPSQDKNNAQQSASGWNCVMWYELFILLVCNTDRTC